ncbi:MAG: monovalent cation:proton antiporter-2 (CPA2) family protein [Verrucomicrobiota bacterium JB025]|nr:monovalent cation:proton antiporter-2 (CPA2) family protein [Verrucomicrobiota bacterium JB025]
MANESMFVSAFIYLVAAVVSVPVAKRLGLSSVLGYLVAGMLIGPFALRLVGEEGQAVMHFSEFGVVMMLFLIGLELRPSMLWRMRLPIIGLGGSQVVLTTLAVTGGALAIGLGWQMALAVGLILALSSTAIVMQSLQEKGLGGTEAGRSAFSVLLFQDIAVIPILAALPLLATLPAAGGGGHDGGGNVLSDWLSHQPGWMNTLMVLGAVVGIIFAGRFVLQPLLALVAGTRVREAFVALALVLVIGIALLMNSLGVSAALGTFLAGVVLADSPYRHELESDIEPFKGILLGVFFISVGASIDFSLVAGNPWLVAGIVAGLFVAKALVLFVLGSFAGQGLDQRLIFSLYLAQGGEFGFVLLGMALSGGVLDERTCQVLVASVALSMALTPLVMLAEEKLVRPRFGTRVAGEREADEMAEDAPVILAGVGRFGNFVARMLRSQGVEVTVIDNDSEHIEFLRRLGIKAFYGDANRHDLLEAAGAAKASVLICTLGGEEQVARLISTARKHFPQLKIMVRAVSRNHEYELVEEGLDFVIHQNAGSAIQMAEAALRELGWRAHRASRAAKTFARHDHAATRALAGDHRDETTYIKRVRQSLSELEELFEQDAKRRERESATPWDAIQLRKDSAAGYPDAGGAKDGD